MHPHDAYKRSTTGPSRRIDLVLTLYRSALDYLARARLATESNRLTDARSLLARTQLIVSGLASGHIGSTEPVALNFLRLYEYVAHRLTQGSVVDIDAATQVLRTLMDGFESARDQAIALEMQGTIPPLESDRIVQVMA